ncbi:hypothetical protein BM221_010784 [Beauveria bassiana]|uniref:Uncharacterized protein n=1 Tax=Beauveria bassiana TaxID=176275 RepID=A0A2N6N7Y3_BEABA|nr:hypothetical protein BM221_010784 [Beauveria bassiana]
MFLGFGNIIGLLVKHTDAVVGSSMSKGGGACVAVVSFSLVHSVSEFPEFQPLGAQVKRVWVLLVGQVIDNMDGVNAELVLNARGRGTRRFGILTGGGVDGYFHPVENISGPAYLHGDDLRVKDMLARAPKNLFFDIICGWDVVSCNFGKWGKGRGAFQ